MQRAFLILMAVMALTPGARAQDLSSCKLPENLERLAAKASEVVNITMDENMLKFAGNFMNKNKPEEAEIQKLIAGLKSICVRSFQFDHEVEFAEQDLQALRSQLRTPTWSPMVSAHDRRTREEVDVYFRMEQGVATGLAVIAVEPKELTFVHINGSINPDTLGKLGGQFGIPKVEMPSGKADGK